MKGKYSQMKTNNRLLTLLKFNLKYFLFPKFNTKKDKRRYIGGMVAVALALGFPVVMLLASMYLMASYATIEQVRTLLGLIFVTSQLATFFFGLTTYLQVMYYSKDHALLSTFPVTSTDVYLSKLITAVVMELFITVLVVIPTTIVTAIALTNAGHSLSILYYVMMLVGSITLPTVTMVIVSLISVVAVRVLSFFQKRPTLGAITAVVLIAVIVGAIYIGIYSNIGASKMASIENSQSGIVTDSGLVVDPGVAQDTEVDVQQEIMANGLISLEKIEDLSLITKIFYNTYCLANIMLGIDVVKSLLIYIAIFIVALGLGIFAAQLSNKKIKAFMVEDTSITRKANKEVTQTSVTKALFRREIFCLSRDTGKMINLLMSVVFGPLFSFLMVFIMNVQIPAGEIDSTVIGMNFGMAFMMAIYMAGGTNVGASAGISLEAKKLAIIKTLPISYTEFFKVKLEILDVLAVISAVLSAAVTSIYAKGNIVDFIGFSVAAIIFIGSSNAFGLLRDLKNPKLNWSNIKEITKNNMSTLIPMLILMPAGLIAIAVGVVCHMFIENSYVCSLALWGSMIAISVLYYFILRFKVLNKVEPLLEAVEV